MPPRGRARVAAPSNRVCQSPDEDSSDSEYLGHFEPAPVSTMLSADPPIPRTSATIMRCITIEGIPYYSVVIKPLDDPAVNSTRASSSASSASRATDRRKITEPVLREGITMDEIYNHVSRREYERFVHVEWEAAEEARAVAEAAEEEAEKAWDMEIRRQRLEALERAALLKSRGPGQSRGRPRGRGRGRGRSRGYGPAGTQRETLSAQQSGEDTSEEIDMIENTAEDVDVIARPPPMPSTRGHGIRGRRGRTRGYGGERWHAGITRSVSAQKSGEESPADMTEDGREESVIDGSSRLPYTNGRAYESSESDTAAAQQLRNDFQMSQMRSRRLVSPEVVIISPKRPIKRQRMTPTVEGTSFSTDQAPSNASSKSSQPELSASSRLGVNRTSLKPVAGSLSNGRTTIVDLIGDIEDEDSDDIDDRTHPNLTISDNGDVEMLKAKEHAPNPIVKGNRPVRKRSPSPVRIEQIIDHLDMDGEVTYCARIVGHSEDQGVWKSAREVKDECPHLLAAYKAAHLMQTGKYLIDEEDSDAYEDQE
ncbi:hypothetical protein EJ05DRAFT_501737 [Pseudovirgaria hyperparasitica]|uniref:Chromo domain-containing protein n=1 Tax=Pseudovirgaria hyperparasitica TaxID=470096 RepID=A0A6A6W3R6_9PEZI|nr:uncharacterized protein EJ05DRAFT_501737 [Pseudovirgaria hyperparasitica]KAF2757205.1 hypothetical protein EJ05DRAFT_501737 [Pseudovirgaria hyperparasitica]